MTTTNMITTEAAAHIIEAALLAYGEPLSHAQLRMLFSERECPDGSIIHDAIAQLRKEYTGRGITIATVKSGYRIQVTEQFRDRLAVLWQRRPQKLSSAALETLALIAYKQPISRAEIEDVRGVSVSSSVLHHLSAREWIGAVGHKDVPGRPVLFGTTKKFLDDFGFTRLDDLPPLPNTAIETTPLRDASAATDSDNHAT